MKLHVLSVKYSPLCSVQYFCRRCRRGRRRPPSPTDSRFIIKIFSLCQYLQIPGSSPPRLRLQYSEQTFQIRISPAQLFSTPQVQFLVLLFSLKGDKKIALNFFCCQKLQIYEQHWGQKISRGESASVCEYVVS